MKRPLWALSFILLALLAGFIGFAAMAEWLPSARQTALQLDVNLTEPQTAQVSSDAAPEPTEKTHETEPEEVPSPSDIEVEIVRHERAQGTPLRVLIYHTHTYEAYKPDFDGQYKQTERWRTADPDYNIVCVGEELAKLLREEYGMQVVHDTTAFEPPNLDESYKRSLEAIENYTARGETFDLYLDLHRDAYAEGRFQSNTVTADGLQAARIMFLIGKGTGLSNDGQAFAQLPEWEKNYARAELITDAINAQADNLCRPVSTKSSRYNQHVSAGALLIELGNNQNTLEEVLRAVPYLARAISETAGGTLSPAQHAVENP